MKERIKQFLDNVANYESIIPISATLFPEWSKNEDNKFNGFIMTANGKGMRKAGINDGDLVFFKRIDTPRHNSLVAAMLEDGSVILRRYLEIDGNRILRRENGRTPDLINPVFEAFGEVVAIHRIIGQGV